MPGIMTGLASAVSNRLDEVIAEYGTLIELKQSGTGKTISDIGAFVELASAGDHTPFFSSVVLDTFMLPLYTVTLAGACPTFSGTLPTTSDFVTMAIPGASTVVDYKIRSITYVCLVAGTPIKTILLVSL